MEKNLVSEEEMREVYESLRTPCKVGMVLAEEGVLMDCPNVFARPDGIFGMIYVRFRPDSKMPGYETWLAVSSDLIHWEPQGKLLTQNLPDRETADARGGKTAGDGKTAGQESALSGTELTRNGIRPGWDCCQKDGSLCLIDPAWGGTLAPERWDGKYWMSYIGGALPGYETDPLRIGMASADEIRPDAFSCLPLPVLAENDPDARAFERTTLYKSCVVRDRAETLGAPFVMFYNAKSQPFSIERIGIAVSRDMVYWQRVGGGAVLENGITDRWNIAGDPQLLWMEDCSLWVMNYYFAGDGTAYDTFACSRDLIHWTKWDGAPLVSPSEDYDARFAHKPFVFRHNGTVYHFYCAVSEQGRGIALAVSRL